MCCESVADPQNVSFMYDEIIQENMDHSESEKRKIQIVDLSFILQFSILMISPIPGFDMYLKFYGEDNQEVTYQLSDFLLAIMWLRLIFIIRMWLNYSIFSDAYAKIL